MTDSERARTYAAEVRAFEGTLAEEPLTFAEVGELVSAIVATTWWTRHGPAEVTLLRGRGARIHSCAEIATATLTISEAQQTPATVAHELAHLAGGRAHDARFRGAGVVLIGALCGPVAADILSEEFARGGLEVISPPPLEDWPQGLLASHPRFGGPSDRRADPTGGTGPLT